MKIISLCLGPLRTNCYILCGENGHAFVIDPAFDSQTIKNVIEAEGLTLSKILLTHAHFDHIMAAEELRDDGVELCMHKQDEEMYIDPLKNSMIEFIGKSIRFNKADRLFSNGDRVDLDGETVKVMHTPGHTRGSVCYIIGNAIFTGDTLFCNGIGRYDLYGGCYDDLMNSLRKLRQLSSDYFVYAGHGQATTLNKEKNDNIYMNNLR